MSAVSPSKSLQSNLSKEARANLVRVFAFFCCRFGFCRIAQQKTERTPQVAH